MRPNPCACRLAVSFALAVAGLAAFAAPARAEPPKLVVVISVDQCRADYLTKYAEFYGEGGFNRLTREGAWFTQARQRHAMSETGPGHAVLLTGCWGRRNGIVANGWFDTRTGKPVYCVEDEAAPIFPTGPTAPAENEKDKDKPGKTEKTEKSEKAEKLEYPFTFDGHRYRGVSPRNLQVTTVGDQLKAATAGKAKVITLSLKDRAAVLLGGHAADGAYWYDTDTGRFTTSAYYRKDLPDWLATFNAGNPADAWRGKTWEKALPESAYAGLRPDNVPYEKPVVKMGPAFPHVLPMPSPDAPKTDKPEKPDKLAPDSPGTKGEAKAEAKAETKTDAKAEPKPEAPKRITPGDYYRALMSTPFGNELLLSAARAAVEGESLGKGPSTDLLAVGISSTDYCGHSWGPGSHEMLDMMVRTDAALEGFLKYLDERFGAGKYVVVLSADHGCGQMPGYLASLKIPAGFVEPKALGLSVEAALREKFGRHTDRPWVLAVGDWMLFLNTELIADRGLDPATVEKAAADALSADPRVAAAFAKSSLAGVPSGPELGDDAVQMWSRDWHPTRSGHVCVSFRPGFGWHPRYPANHGTIYDEDQHVPLVFFGAGVKPGRHDARVGVIDLAPTLSALLGISPPPAAQGRVLAEALK